MKNKAVIFGFFGVILLMAIGVILIIVNITSKASDKDEFSSIDLVEERDIVNSKLAAYNAQFQDSIVAVRDENVKVNIGKLWGSKVDQENVSDSDLNQLFDEVMNDETIQEEPLKQSIQKPASRTYTKPRTTIKPVQQTSTATTKQDNIHQEQSIEDKYPEKDGFISSFEDKKNSSNSTEVISAVVHSKQAVQSNTQVKFRLTQSINLDGKLIPEGTFISGKATLYNERVRVDFESIILDGKLVPFKYTAYDPDGWQGIHVPGLVINEAARELVQQSASNASARINVPIVGSVAINTAQKENNKSVATLAQDYPVFLKPE